MQHKAYIARAQTQPRRRYLRIGVVCAALGVLLLLASVVSACPTCADGLASGDEAQRAYAAAFGYSIVFMMSMPFLILGTFGSFAYFSIRKAQAQRDAELDA